MMHNPLQLSNIVLGVHSVKPAMCANLLMILMIPCHIAAYPNNLPCNVLHAQGQHRPWPVWLRVLGDSAAGCLVGPAWT